MVDPQWCPERQASEHVPLQAVAHARQSQPRFLTLAPDLRTSSPLVASSGVTVTLTGGATYDPRVDGAGGTSANTALNIVAGNAGSTTILRTGTTFGVHGLYANTAYQHRLERRGRISNRHRNRNRNLHFDGDWRNTSPRSPDNGPSRHQRHPPNRSRKDCIARDQLHVRQHPTGSTGSTLTLVWARLSTPSLETCSSTWAQA